ncbi:Protein IMPACT [Hondaea fermentalgiana]|uniref:Protein IMPACT n=1 Tax=Hondaea fermentalgiana TaxID=2315210 RepID=A0A2R5GTQ5_9STRA|nr:Protein IMPACT [Hondaea fermentalgiana]|eukprot:GBG34242.1 Protein IMPACT [Hondaea fermentalgiana]
MERHGGAAAAASVRLQDPAELPEHIVPAVLRVDFPDTYPSVDPPVASLKNWPKRDQVEGLHAEMLALFVPNEMVVFSWVEFLREKLNEIADAEPKPPAHTPQPATDAASTTETFDDAHDADDAASSFLSSPPPPAIAVVSGETFTTQKSSFQAHVAKVTSAADAIRVVNSLKQDRKILRATHNMVAYRIERGDRPGSFVCDNDDDGENAAGSKLAHLLDIVDARNVVVVVSRWYGGIHLGPSRFKIINNVARELLLQEGFITGAGD